MDMGGRRVRKKGIENSGSNKSGGSDEDGGGS